MIPAFSSRFPEFQIEIPPSSEVAFDVPGERMLQWKAAAGTSAATCASLHIEIPPSSEVAFDVPGERMLHWKQPPGRRLPPVLRSILKFRHRPRWRSTSPANALSIGSSRRDVGCHLCFAPD
jgi:hypothetical protein